MTDHACLACGHSIDRHFGESSLHSRIYCGMKDSAGLRCGCLLHPSEVADALIADFLRTFGQDVAEWIALEIEAKGRERRSSRITVDEAAGIARSFGSRPVDSEPAP